MTRMRLAFGFLAGSCLLGAACDHRQCAALSDCAGDEVCVRGLCEKSTGGQPPLRDAGVQDSGQRAGGDASVLTDAGGFDAATGAPDAGPRPDGGAPSGDAGVGTLPSQGDLGFVWAGELYDSETTSAFHALGLLQHLDAAAYAVTDQTFVDPEGTSCRVSTRRLTGGSVTGFEAQEISVIPGPQPFSPFSMYPVGNGRFEPVQDPVQRIYNKSRFASFQIFGTGTSGSVDSTLVQVPAPPFLFEDLSYPRGSVVAISPSPQLLWRPSELSNGVITVEVFDVPREVVLTCLVDDDGAYAIPPGAVSSFLGEAPTPPVYLEIRYDRETTASATVQGGGALSVTYRASQGLRYRVALP